MSSIFHVESLPSEVFAAVSGFLAGPDLLALSHVNQSLLNDLLPRDSEIWKQRLGVDECPGPISAKQRYFTSRSYQFPGLRIGARGRKQRGGAIALSRGISTVCNSLPSSFSISIRFSLARDTPTTYAGGILLGAQSASVGDHSWPYYHQQFIHVDPDGNLYCSVTHAKKPVARDLQRERWYHVVLTYEIEKPSGRRVQSVYLDGELIQTSYGSLHHEWYQVSHWQFGSGCISGGAKGAPTPRYCGWYGFNGLINSPRIWTHALSSDEIQRLDDITARKDAYGFVSWLASFYLDVKRVRSSLPAEGAVQVYGEGVQVAGDAASDREDAGVIGMKFHASSKQGLTFRPVPEQTPPIYIPAPVEFFDSVSMDFNTRTSKRRRIM